MVYEVDPLVCPKCGGKMRIISFIEQDEVIRCILAHCGLWQENPTRPPPATTLQRQPLLQTEEYGDYIPDYNVCEDMGYAE